MKLLNRLFIALLLLSSAQLSAQNVKGLHVNDFKNIIGDPVEENILLAFAQEHQFNYLLLYNLYHIQKELFDFTQVNEAQPLADFIYKAKTEYGIEAIGAVGEKFASFDKIISYNNARTNQPLEQFDVLHIEFEFWNKKAIELYHCATYLEELDLPCDTSGAFTFYIDNLIQTTAAAHDLGLLSETYIGNPNASHCAIIGQHVDRVMLHHYRKSDVYANGNSIYNFKKYRLEALVRFSDSLTVLPIFSSRSHFMGPWLLENPMNQAYHTYLFGENGFEEEQGEWKESINLAGHQWYRYTDLINYVEQASSAGLSLTPFVTTNEKEAYEVAFNKNANNKNATMDLVEVYPTLATDFIRINCAAHSSIQMIGIDGQLTLQLMNSGTTNIIDCENLNRGMYILRVGKEGNWSTKKVILVQTNKY